MHIPVSDVLAAASIPAFLLEPGPNGDPVFVMCNAPWFDILNMTPETAYGRTIAEIVAGAAGEGALKYHRQALIAKEPVRYSVSVPIGRSFGKMTSTVAPIRDAEGRLKYLFGTTQDTGHLNHGQIVEMRFESLAQEIDNLTSYLSAKLLNQLHQVSEVAADLLDGFVDLGDGKLQTLEQIEQDAQVAASMVVEVLGRARATRVATDADNFDLSDLLRNEIEALDPNSSAQVSSIDQIVMSDRETVRVILRNVLFTTGFSEGRVMPAIRVTAEVDSPGMIAITLETAQTGFAYAASAFAGETTSENPRATALDTALEIVRQRGGEFYAETANDTDIIQFTMPGYILENEQLQEKLA